MHRPHVVTHVLVSLDGHIEGFPPAVARYYELSARLPHEAVLTGSGTMVAAAADAGVDLSGEDDAAFPGSGAAPADPSRPLLVVVDSGARLTRFDWLRETGLFSDVLVLGSASTPHAHHARLRTAGVGLDVFGEERVDLEAALRGLHETYAINRLRVDAGPGLNGALLAAGLVDEVSVLLAPFLAGEGRGFLDGFTGRNPQALQLTSAEPQPDGHVWLRYAVEHAR